MISSFTTAKWFVFDLTGPFRWFKTKEEALQFINNDSSFRLLEIHGRQRTEKCKPFHVAKRSC
jgi:hypothetical protein